MKNRMINTHPFSGISRLSKQALPSDHLLTKMGHFCCASLQQVWAASTLQECLQIQPHHLSFIKGNPTFASFPR